MGRPVTITQTDISDVLALVVGGSTTIAACARVGMSIPTFYKRLNDDEDLKAEYNQAREAAAHTLAEQTLMIADGQMPAVCDLVLDTGEIIKGGWIDNTIESRKLRVSARQWIVERWNRRDYHTRTDTAVNLSGNQSSYVDQLAAIHRAASDRMRADAISSQVSDADVSSQVSDAVVGEIVAHAGVVEGGTPKSSLAASAVTPQPPEFLENETSYLPANKAHDPKFLENEISYLPANKAHDPKILENENLYPPANYHEANNPTPLQKPNPEKNPVEKLPRKDYREGN